MVIHFALAYFIELNPYIPMTSFFDTVSGTWDGALGPYRIILQKTINPDLAYQPIEYGAVYAVMWWFGAILNIVLGTFVVWSTTD